MNKLGQSPALSVLDKLSNGNGKNHNLNSMAVEVLEPSKNDIHRTLPFSPSMWKLLDADNSLYLELGQNHKLYNILVKYVVELQASKKTKYTSFEVETYAKPTWFDPSKVVKNVKTDRNTLTLGLGLHEFDHDGQRIRILHQVVGEPVGTGCGVEELRNLVLFVDKHAGGTALLKSFCDALVEWDERTIDKVYRIYQWNARNMFWQNMATKLIRPIESVILPSVLKDRIVSDIDSFVAPETAKWYFEHGISYKRTYLFYGPPGAGKSSFIRVLAGHLGRNLCFLQPANPTMTDESMQLCLQQAPENAIVVIEDIDALFDEERNKKSNECPLTFSGLLNALDGIANRDGQIFVLTTNYIDRLDKALIRPGRVDLRIAFPHANAEQVKGLFLHFYPSEVAYAEKFAAEIVKRYGVPGREEEGELNGKLSMAALQQHFILCRKASAAETVTKLAEFDFCDS